MNWKTLVTGLLCCATTVPTQAQAPVPDAPARCEAMKDAGEQRACLLERAARIEVCAAMADNGERLRCYDTVTPPPGPVGTSSLPLRCAAESSDSAREACRLTLARRTPDCAFNSGSKDRLKCADSVTRVVDDDKVPVDPALGWKLREEVSINALGTRAVGTSGAKLTYTDDKHGKETLKGAVAALYVWPDQRGLLNDWQSFAGLGWKGDSGSTPRSESVTASIGAQTTRNWLGIEVQPTMLLSQRHERYADKDTTQFTLNNDFLFNALQGTLSNGVGYDFVPLLGFNIARVSAPTASGTSAGGYAGLRFTLNHVRLFPRTTLEGFGQWYGDARAEPGAQARRTRYATLKLVHNLADPKAIGGWVPAITLSGTRGTEPVRGDKAISKVGVELSAKFN